MRTEIYKTHMGDEFAFNDLSMVWDPVAPIAERIGRLVQVRKGVGAFGSDQIFMRTESGRLQCYENCWLKLFNDPVEIERDDENIEYSLSGDFPETGFIIKEPKQPETQAFCSMMIVKGSK